MRRSNAHSNVRKNDNPFTLSAFENLNNIFFEDPPRLINDDTGETVGVVVTESMDVRIMQNALYAANQL